MKRKPGPLTRRDTQEIAAFQKAHDCIVDGKIGRQTKDALWARLAKGPHAFDWWSALVGGLVFGFLALLV